MVSRPGSALRYPSETMYMKTLHRVPDTKQVFNEEQPLVLPFFHRNPWEAVSVAHWKIY